MRITNVFELNITLPARRSESVYNLDFNPTCPSGRLASISTCPYENQLVENSSKIYVSTISVAGKRKQENVCMNCYLRAS